MSREEDDTGADSPGRDKTRQDRKEGGHAAERLPNFWQLRIFDTVARLENLSKASEDLLRSQPAISSAIAKLEKLLGVTLFERTRTGTYPTEVGVALMVRVHRIQAALTQALVDVCGLPETNAEVVAPGITRTQIRVLDAISRTDTFNEAARAVAMSETSLLRAARQLERNLGGKFFLNSARGMTTTEAGDALARRFALIMAMVESACEHVRNYELPSDRKITVGVLLLDPSILLTRAIREMRSEFRDMRVAVVSGSYEALLQKLNSGTIDVMIGLLKRPDYARAVREEPLYRESYLVVARNGHPLCALPSVSVSDLFAYNWILPQRGSPRRLAFEQIFSKGAAPSASIETYSLNTIREVLRTSEMLTVLSASEMESEASIGHLASIRFEVPAPGPMIGLTYGRHWTPNAGQAEFLNAIRRANSALQREKSEGTSDNVTYFWQTNRPG